MSLTGLTVITIGSNLWIFSMLLWTLSYVTVNFIYNEAKVTTVHRLEPAYDYVVVGAGSAGSVIATRLGEEAGVTVAVVEEGGHENVLSEVPGLAGDLQLTYMDWQYRAQPSSTTCLAMKNNRCNLPRGHVVGGSSSINYMLYVRGNRLDYDHWEALGNPDWGFSSVFPFFLKSEGHSDPADPKYHGVTGPLTVEKAPWTTPLSDAFLRAGQELGYPVLDVNAASQSGFMVPDAFLRRSARCSNAKAFLRPGSRRHNLHVVLKTLVTKVIIDPSTMRATGVELSDGMVVEARREVVVCAGAINTPQLLMLSGIGPATHLESLKIPVLKDLPVGRNLQDHVAASVVFTTQEPVSLLQHRVGNVPSALQYALLGTGPLASLGGVEGIAFVNTSYANVSVDWPDVQFHFVAGSYASDGGRHLRYTLGLKEQYWATYYKPLTIRDHFSIIVVPTRPRSRGYVRLLSRDPRRYPEVVTNYLSEQHDVKVLVDGMRLAWQLGNTQAFRGFGAKYYDGIVPGCEHLKPATSTAWECIARHFTLAFYHLCGTARMGPPGHPDTVVDPSLKVVGVSGLRVADASVFPTIPSGNTNAAVTMVAERAAALILQERRSLQQAAVATLPAQPDGTTSALEKRARTKAVKDAHYDL
ncbi:glucose dehydrogenase [FAD, quinone]-like isoform X1 [Eriocheir sinensis]|uniref:glucose dehydrogenase [FAD, quinone]-like isoform X1 n=1 Tax=Eriocheir sinensis TaxID=95602 RepID=UPI0021CAD6BF|nr:glucose dehydrogenase [FAD, quinone]-like isoform X1 [Eriocheir sinensis]